MIKKYAPSKSILGVCLGHQAIGETFGSSLENMDVVLHGFGMTSNIVDDEEVLFSGIEKQFTTARYHSWVIDKNKVGADLKVTAMSEERDSLLLCLLMVSTISFLLSKII